MQAFTSYSPAAFTQNPHALKPCALLHCEAVVPFGHMVVWGWVNQDERNFRAFCCQKCALEALPGEFFNHG